MNSPFGSKILNIPKMLNFNPFNYTIKLIRSVKELIKDPNFNLEWFWPNPKELPQNLNLDKKTTFYPPF